MLRVVLYDYIPLQNDLTAFVELLGHELKVLRKLLLNHGAFAHIFRFALGEKGQNKRV